MSGKKRSLSTFNRVKKDNAGPSEYECEKCGKKFGNSLGDMELQNNRTPTKRRYRSSSLVIGLYKHSH